jgi:HlyD family secretion protein
LQQKIFFRGKLMNVTNKSIENDKTHLKKISGKALIGFFVGMLVLTFFSRTINNLTIPRVKVAKPKSGALVKEIRGDGFVEACEAYKVFHQNSDAKVEYLAVHIGDKVKKGQVLLVLDTKQLTVELQRQLKRYEAGAITYDQMLYQVARFDQTAQVAKIELARLTVIDKKRKLGQLKVLYHEGAESLINYQQAELDLKEAEKEHIVETAVLEEQISNNKLLLKDSVFLG